MIGRLTGRIESVALDTLIVDVQGVGYEVSVPPGLPGRLDYDEDKHATVFIHTNVRDDAIDLYGFATQGQKELFGRLTSVSGIGPKTALGVLSAMSPPEVVKAVRANRMEAFKEVKGIGEKTAQRLILEMKSVVDDLDLAEVSPPAKLEASDERIQDLRSALSNLGYEAPTINSVIDRLGSDIEEADGVEPLIRKSLELLR